MAGTGLPKSKHFSNAPLRLGLQSAPPQILFTRKAPGAERLHSSVSLALRPTGELGAVLAPPIPVRQRKARSRQWPAD